MDEIKLNLENLTTDEREQLMKLVEKGNVITSDKTKNGKPKYNEEYWTINKITDLVPAHFYWTGCSYDNSRYAMGWIYKTEDECKFAIEKYKVETELKIFAKEHNKEGFHVFDSDARKWDLNYNIDEDLVEALSMYGYISSMTIFSSEEVAKQAIESVGEDRIKKYIFGVKTKNADSEDDCEW